MKYRIVRNGLGEYGVERFVTKNLGDLNFHQVWELQPERYKTKEDAENAIKAEQLRNKWEVVG